MVPKCKMEAAVDVGYRVIAGQSGAGAAVAPADGGGGARPGAGSSGGNEAKLGLTPQPPLGSSRRS
jgi:hypothetical protein